MTAYEVILGYYKIAESDLLRYYKHDKAKGKRMLEYTSGYMEGLAIALDQLATTDEQIAEVEKINNTLNEIAELI